ncbi:interferon gamma-like [Anabas testudineus]|uniref:Interferon gamma n=1 Tax=Anabas testudineus TaxID=64144 RepID=A0A3Q1KEU6_ANATE|nr:interferon gamma-like [Anabas testudineus]
MKVATARAVVCLSLWLSVCQVSGFHIPAKMNRTIQNLLQHYKISPKERFNGKPVFSREPLDGNMQVKRVFMGGVLETYEKLLSKMLEELPTPSPQTTGSKDRPASDVIPAPGTANGARSEAGGDVRKGLSDILEMVQKLRKHNYQDLEKLMQGLHSLKHVQMNNAVVQSKALWELPWLYEEASSLSEIQMRRRRRRRQARKLKAHQRA